MGSVTEAGKRPRGSLVSQMRRQLVDKNDTDAKIWSKNGKDARAGDHCERETPHSGEGEAECVANVKGRPLIAGRGTPRVWSKRETPHSGEGEAACVDNVKGRPLIAGRGKLRVGSM